MKKFSGRKPLKVHLKTLTNSINKMSYFAFDKFPEEAAVSCPGPAGGSYQDTIIQSYISDPEKNANRTF